MSAPHALPQMPHPILPPGHSTDGERVLSLRIMKYWANFAHTGRVWPPNTYGQSSCPLLDLMSLLLQLSPVTRS